MAAGFDIKDFEKRMSASIASLRHEFGGLRTGRASAALLDPIVVSAYGASMPLNQIGSVSVPDPRTITVQVWDKSHVSAVEKAIRDSNLGLNPVIDGTTLRLPIPAPNEERRRELAKLAAKYAEATRVAVRNVRRDGMDALKRLEKDGEMGEDQVAGLSAKVQTATDKAIKEIDGALSTKEQEIMQV